MTASDPKTSRIQGEDPFAQHLPWLQRLARSLVLDESRAGDVVQQVLFAALRQKPKSDRDLKPWLASVARKIAFNQRRAEARRIKNEKGASKEREITVEFHPEAMQREMAQILMQFVKGLEEPYRTTIELHFFEGLSQAEVAQRMKLPKATVQSRLRRGLMRLRAKMDKRFASRENWCLPLLPLLGPGDLASGSILGGGASASARPVSWLPRWGVKLAALAMWSKPAATTAALFLLVAIPTAAIVGMRSGNEPATGETGDDSVPAVRAAVLVEDPGENEPEPAIAEAAEPSPEKETAGSVAEASAAKKSGRGQSMGFQNILNPTGKGKLAKEFKMTVGKGGKPTGRVLGDKATAPAKEK